MNTTNNNANWTLGVLSTTAVIMLAAFLWLNIDGDKALADGMTVSGGDYIMTVGEVSIADEEYVYILDVPTERLIAYHFNTANHTVEIIQGINLGEIRKMSNKAGQRRSRGRPSRNRRP